MTATQMTMHEFCLFVDGADLKAAKTIERLACVGYSHPAAGAHDGVQALVFSCGAKKLADAVAAVVAAAEGITGLFVAREARSGDVPVFDPTSLELAATCSVAVPATPVNAATTHKRHNPARRRHANSFDS